MARPVRFNIHPKGTDIHDNIAIAGMPEGSMGEGYFATS
ncbi:MAG: NADH-quinone oxidoreductase subunit B, partial [Parafilimonas sp.]|nr:NADH-quinone oxidoreductase subunit B [Parafilimonas sp.]